MKDLAGIEGLGQIEIGRGDFGSFIADFLATD